MRHLDVEVRVNIIDMKSNGVSLVCGAIHSNNALLQIVLEFSMEMLWDNVWVVVNVGAKEIEVVLCRI